MQSENIKKEDFVFKRADVLFICNLARKHPNVEVEEIVDAWVSSYELLSKEMQS